MTPAEIPKKFRRKFTVDVNSGCWLWTACTRDGYGRYHNGTKLIEAHRFSYEFYKGPILDSLEIDHKCRIKSCVNPDHLEAVSHKENLLRSPRLNRTHCPKGHEYTIENTILTPKNYRKCRECDNLGSRSRRNRYKKLKDNVTTTPTWLYELSII